METFDPVDLKILFELQKNSRTSYRILGRATGMSGVTVKKRIDRMIKQGIIDRFITFVDYRIFGYKEVYLTLGGYSRRSKDHENIFSILNLMGRISLYIPCIGDINAFHILIKEDAQQKISDIRKILQRFIVNVVYDSAGSFRFTKLAISDYEIMHVLIKNPQMQINEIAREVSLSKKTVKRRIKTLTDKGILRFGICHNLQKISGYIPFAILLHANTDNFNIVKKIQKIADSNFLTEPYVNDKIVVLHLHCSNIYIANEIFEQIRDINGIDKAQVFFPNDIIYYQKWLIEELERHHSYM